MVIVQEAACKLCMLEPRWKPYLEFSQSLITNRREANNNTKLVLFNFPKISRIEQSPHIFLYSLRNLWLCIYCWGFEMQQKNYECVCRKINAVIPVKTHLGCSYCWYLFQRWFVRCHLGTLLWAPKTAHDRFREKGASVSIVLPQVYDHQCLWMSVTLAKLTEQLQLLRPQFHHQSCPFERRFHREIDSCIRHPYALDSHRLHQRSRRQHCIRYA